MGLLSLSTVFALERTESTFADSADGSKSATAFVPKGGGVGQITDLSYDLDTNVQTGTVSIRVAEQEKAINSATSGTGTVLWFDNDPTLSSATEYVIFWDDSAKEYFLYNVVASAATSVTIAQTAPISTTNDRIYPCAPQADRYAANVVSSTLGECNIWVPSDLPSALSIDGNTTSCRISVSGRRVKY